MFVGFLPLESVVNRSVITLDRGTFSTIRYNILDISNIRANDRDKLIADDVI